MTEVMIPLAVASDRSLSLAYSSQRLINVYPEKSQFGGKSPFLLIWAPGLKPLWTVGVGPWRGGLDMGDYEYVVSDTRLYELDEDGNTRILGTVPGEGYVTMATAGTQLAICNGTSGFIYDSSDDSFQLITDTDLETVTAVTALDGYFIWSNGDDLNTRWQFSDLLDGLAYDALDFANAESSAKELVRPYVVGSQILMFKRDRIEIWVNSGNADFPFERENSSIIPKGLAAKFSPAQLDNTVFWLGRDDEAGGGPIVYRLNGYNSEVISTPDVARALAEVEDLDEIRGCAYIKDNHAFYGVILPSGNSWWYDASMGEWHERSTYQRERWLGNGLMNVFGKTLVGSYVDGTIYEMDQDTFEDGNGIPLIAEFTAPTFGTDGKVKKCSRLRLDMQTGVGLATGQGSDPLVTLNISDDRGYTYSSDLEASIGRMGQHGIAVEWRRLGQFRSRVHRFRVSDPVKRAFIALYAEIN